jgi:hydrogenase maturation protease
MRDALPGPDGRALVIGIGNVDRGDDGVGVEAARLLARRVCDPRIEIATHVGDGLGLLHKLEGVAAVVLIDAARSGSDAGQIRRLDLGTGGLAPSSLRGCSTHAVGVAEALELGRVLGRVPAKVVVLAVEGRRFGVGQALSDEVARAIPEVAERALAEAARTIGENPHEPARDYVTGSPGGADGAPEPAA